MKHLFIFHSKENDCQSFIYKVEIEYDFKTDLQKSQIIKINSKIYNLIIKNISEKDINLKFFKVKSFYLDPTYEKKYYDENSNIMYSGYTFKEI